MAAVQSTTAGSLQLLQGRGVDKFDEYCLFRICQRSREEEVSVDHLRYSDLLIQNNCHACVNFLDCVLGEFPSLCCVLTVTGGSVFAVLSLLSWLLTVTMCAKSLYSYCGHDGQALLSAV